MPSIGTTVRRVHEDPWHVRGHAGFAVALAVMAAAAAVTGTFRPAVLGVLAACLAVVVVVFLALRSVGHLDRSWSLLLWPVAVCTSLLAFSTVANEAATLLSGLIVLSFLFIGLCQRPGRGLWFVPAAVVVMIVVSDLDLAAGVIRVPIAVLVWVTVSELPARLFAELHEQREALRRVARTDSLTGLMNRNDLRAELEAAGPLSSIALIDLDHFKRFNDENGHVAGDRALEDFARVLRDGTRQQDLLFRYGGEEFLVIFPDLTVDEAATTLRRVAGAWADHTSELTFSGGVAPGGAGVVRHADEQLYLAKAAGRNRIHTATLDDPAGEARLSSLL